jgi:tetratricopeptide (TPR) repeat protein
MFPVSFGRRALVVSCAVLVAVALVSPAAAQTGVVRGKVVDAKGAPVEAAKVTIQLTDGIPRTYVVKSDKKGDYAQIGLVPGPYKVTAEKEKVGFQTLEGRVRIGETLDLSFKLTPGGGPGPSKEELAKAVAIKKVFEEGVALSRTDDYDGAIAKFAEAIAIVPTCAECYHNTGHAYAQKKEWDKSEQAYKKAIELRPDYIEAYNGLSQIYTLQKKFDAAQAASQKAAELAMASGGTGGGGGTEAVFNVGVTAWNAGKAEEAKKAFEEVLKIDPKYANAHYQLAMCWVNLGKMPEAIASFEAYLQNAPDGQYAAQVKAMLTQLKK